MDSQSTHNLLPPKTVSSSSSSSSSSSVSLPPIKTSNVKTLKNTSNPSPSPSPTKIISPSFAPPHNNDNYKLDTSSTKTSILDQTSHELAQSLINDLPLLMYGSGDIYPYRHIRRHHHHHHHIHYQKPNENNEETSSIIEYQTNLKTTSLLAHLTTSFIHDLVNAAIDSHDIFTDGKSGNGGGIIPKKNYHCQSNHQFTNENEKKRNFMNSLQSTKAKKSSTAGSISNSSNHQSVISEWEDELPIPTITSHQKLHQQYHKQFEEKQHDHQQQRKHNPLLHWQGVQGLNVDSNKIRSKYLSPTTTINEKSFLLPICHDVEMYNRCKENISFHDDAVKILFDDSVREFVRDGIEENEIANSSGGGGGAEDSGSSGGGGGKKGNQTGKISSDSGKQERDAKRQRTNSFSSNEYSGLNMIYGWPGVDDVLKEVMPTTNNSY